MYIDKELCYQMFNQSKSPVLMTLLQLLCFIFNIIDIRFFTLNMHVATILNLYNISLFLKQQNFYMLLKCYNLFGDMSNFVLIQLKINCELGLHNGPYLINSIEVIKKIHTYTFLKNIEI